MNLACGGKIDRAGSILVDEAANGVIAQAEDLPKDVPSVDSPETESETNEDCPTIQEGIASWYHCPGRKAITASGEIYVPDTFSAAHRKLPFGTIVRVTNLENGKDCKVRINDRGPYIDGRIIDLTPRGAREIEMYEPGIVPVRVEVLRFKKRKK